jgi:uncharacterized protein (DUF779 family)
MVEVVLTEEARAVLAAVRASRRGDLALVIGNGCCDSTAPFLFEDYLAGPNEDRVAELDGGVTVLLDSALRDLFDGREVVIDIAPGPAPDSFSCESELGVRFSLARMPGVGAA